MGSTGPPEGGACVIAVRLISCVRMATEKNWSSGVFIGPSNPNNAPTTRSRHSQHSNKQTQRVQFQSNQRSTQTRIQSNVTTKQTTRKHESNPSRRRHCRTERKRSKATSVVGRSQQSVWWCDSFILSCHGMIQVGPKQFSRNSITEYFW